MAAWYNDTDPLCAAWLRELITRKQIADGEVDTRSIVDVQPADLRGFSQCHFFAGIGGWSYALRLAGWPDDRAVWTGSCPCQPFSAAGTQAGGADPRDLWPAWFRLLRECRPRVVLGEQVEAAIGHGWLDRLCADLEGEGYAVGPVGLPSASVGAFDIRQRLWFVADTSGSEWGAHAEGRRDVVDVADAGREEAPSRSPMDRTAGELGDTDESGSQGRRLGRVGASECAPWAASLVEWIPCSDGKLRPVESGTFPLAHGVPARVGRLRGYGNAINPWVAKEVIAAYLSQNR